MGQKYVPFVLSWFVSNFHFWNSFFLYLYFLIFTSLSLFLNLFSTCISLSVFCYLYFSIYISLSVFLYLYFSTSISLAAFLYLYFSTCISLPVFLYLYFSTCISLAVFLYLYFSTCKILVHFLLTTWQHWVGSYPDPLVPSETLDGSPTVHPWENKI